MPKRKFIDIELREDERALETVAAASDSKGVDGSRGKTDKSDSVATDILFRRPGRLERCLLYTSPSPRDKRQSRMPSSA